MPASDQDSGKGAIAQLPRRIGHGLVTIYRYTLAPLIGPRCRHLPSCSEYADEALARFGLWAGSWMALARITR
ncbi:MAG: membrane protein insertion efficiency factor YidD, partial [Pseudolabrys sp.]